MSGERSLHHYSYAVRPTGWVVYNGQWEDWRGEVVYQSPLGRNAAGERDAAQVCEALNAGGAKRERALRRAAR